MNGSTTLNAITNGLNNLTINNSGGVILGGAITVNGTLTLTDGPLNNGANLTMASGTTISRTATGSLTAAPVFGTSIDLIYTGSSAIATGYEIPTSSTVLMDLTTNAGGVTQSGTPSGGTVSTIYTQGFNAAPADWTTEIVTDPTGTAPAIAYVTSAASTYPTVAFTEGGIGVEFNSWYCEAGDQIRLKKTSSPLATTGKTLITVIFDWYVDPGYSSSNDYVTVQWSSDGITWNNSTSYYRYNYAASWVTQNCILPSGAENQATLYIAFLFTSVYGNNCHLDNLKVNVTTPGTPTASAVTVNGTMDLTNGSYSIGAGNSLALNGGLSGTNAIAGSATSNLSVGGTGSALVIPSVTGGLNNFTISRANGVTLKSDLTVNGVLTLSANASSTKGSLDMLDGSTMKTLTMGESATTIGTGDVTGIVKRTTLPSLVAGTPYTFGNQFTIVNFQDIGTLPSEVSVKITLGSAPSWKTNAIQRTYDFIHTGGSGCYATVDAHYLDSELNGITESDLSWWSCDTPFTPGTEVEHGRSNYDVTDNWVGLSSVPLSIWPTSFGTKVETFGATGQTDYTWNGSFDTDWLKSANWTPVGVPSDLSDVVIPTNAGSTHYDPVLPTDPSAVQTLTIENGGILYSAATSSLTIGGGNGAWINQGGTFYPGTGTVTFTNAYATLAGTTNFYNLTISSDAALILETNSTTRIAGTMTNNGIWRAALNPGNTVEYNGGDQTVLNPNAPIPGYRNLILSGTGTKTMPGTALSIAEDLSVSGTASATAGQALTVGGNVTLGSGTTLNMGSYSHTISGDVTNNGGTFTPSSGSITLNGTGLQTLTSSAGISFNNLTITNTSADVTLGASTDCAIGGDLTINSGAVFNLAANRLTAVTGSLSSSGTVKTQSTSSTPVPAGRTWGGAFEYTGSAAQTMVEGAYNNLTMNGAGGATADAGITVNGILNLSSANPSSSKGILDMGTNTLLMGPSSTTIGQSDVTGIISRTTIAHSTTYSFGNQYSTIYFPNVGTLPSEISLKVSLGTAPTWRTGAILRIYDLIQTGGSGTQALISCHYLDSELNGNNENSLVVWLQLFPSTTIEYGRSEHNATDNWVLISNVNVGVFSSDFGDREITLDEASDRPLTWNGSTSTSWVTAFNWTPIASPSDNTAITIPDAATTTYDPEIPAVATCGTMKIESGGILNAAIGSQLTVNGADGAWSNLGTFNPGSNSTIVFKNANAVMDGSSDFNNLIIYTGAGLSLENNTYMGITGTVINHGTIYAVEEGATTIEYKGGFQTVAVPNSATNRYSTLILSGTGTKTMPGTAFTIQGDFSVSGTASATAGNSLTIDGNTTIGNGTSFETGAYGHSIGGNFTNNGTFTATSGSTITLSGTAAQSIGGTSATTFYNLTIDNAAGVTMAGDQLATVTGVMLVNDGKKFEIGAGKKLTVSGTFTNNAGNSGLVIKSDGTNGTGSLIEASGAEATVERYIDYKVDNSAKWHFLSSPIIEQKIRNDQFAPSGDFGTGNWTWDFYYFNPNAPATGYRLYWVNLRNVDGTVNTNPVDESGNNAGFGSADPSFISGRGYLVAYDNSWSTVHSFAGSLHAGIVSRPLIYNASGWTMNLVGNPYPSSIDWKSGNWGTGRDALEASGSGFDYWIWNDAAVGGGNYGVYNSGTGSGTNGTSQYIAPEQAFFVKAGSSGSLGMNDNIRAHSSQTWLKDSETASNLIRLRFTTDANDYSDEMIVDFNPAYAGGGSDKMWSFYEEAPEICAVKDAQYYSIDRYKEPTAELTVPLYVKTGVDASYTILAVDVNDFALSEKIYLDDLKSGGTQELKASLAYTFAAKPGDDPARFRLRFAGPYGVDGPGDRPEFTVYAIGNTVYIKNHTGDVVAGNAYICDMLGRKVAQNRIAGKNSEIAVTAPTGVYLVTLVTDHGTYSRKIFIQ